MEKVFGIDAAVVALHPTQPILAYAAGAVVVLLNYSKKQEQSFLSPWSSKMPSIRPISCLSISNNGTLLAVGEVKYFTLTQRAV